MTTILQDALCVELNTSALLVLLTLSAHWQPSMMGLLAALSQGMPPRLCDMDVNSKRMCQTGNPLQCCQTSILMS